MNSKPSLGLPDTRPVPSKDLSVAQDSLVDPLSNGRIFHVKDVTAMTSPRPNHILKAAMLQRANRDSLSNPFLSPTKNLATSSSLISRMLSLDPHTREVNILENTKTATTNALHFQEVSTEKASKESLSSFYNIPLSTNTLPKHPQESDVTPQNITNAFESSTRGDFTSNDTNKVTPNANVESNLKEHVFLDEIIESNINNIASPMLAGPDVSMFPNHSQASGKRAFDKNATSKTTDKENDKTKVSNISEHAKIRPGPPDCTIPELTLQEKFMSPDTNSDPVSDVTLVDWRLQRVPNDQQITKHSVIDYPLWIILEGKRILPDGSLQPWHSSLISIAKSSHLILTASGKLYKLQGPMNIEGMEGGGWSLNTIQTFSNGFPLGATWIQILSSELQLEIRKNIRRSMSQNSTSKANEHDHKIKEISNQQKSQSNMQVLRETHKVVKENKIKVSPNEVKRPSKAISEKRIASDNKIPRRLSEPSLSSGITNNDKRVPSPLHTTRSGRKVYPPLAFWENVYLVGAGIKGEDPLIVQADTPDRLSLSSRLALNSKSPGIDN